MWQAFNVELPVFLRVFLSFLKEVVVMMLSLIINCIKALSHISYLYVYIVTQMVKNLPAVWETWVQSLGLEDPLEEGMATHLPGEFHEQRLRSTVSQSWTQSSN